MSSTYSGWGLTASKSIDDDLDNLCHTKPDTLNPWLSITVSAVTDVFKVVVWNRNDCCFDLLSPLEVWVGNSNGAADGELCGGAAVTLPATSGPFEISCEGLSGSVVTLLLPGTRTLHLAEVYVYRSELHHTLFFSLSNPPLTHIAPSHKR